MVVKLPRLEQLKEFIVTVTKLLSMITCLYFFICSLSFLSTSFRVLGGRNISAFFSNSSLLQNPVVGAMIGVIVTVLVQSSSTSTSIIVGLVSAGTPVNVAIPMVLGANIGTSVTNTIVSITQMGDKEQFRRAFAAATVHDMFNWLNVIFLLIIESTTHYLEVVSGAMVQHMSFNTNVTNPDFLKVITNPLVKSVIKLDKKVLDGWALNDPKYENVTSILKTNCNTNTESSNNTCNYLLAYLGPEGSNIGDIFIGIILLIFSLILLCGCLLGMVKVLNSLLGGKVESIIKNVVNSDIPNKYLSWLTGYLAMILGAILTILVQSSSVFTSTLTPLAGTGLISLERIYPLSLGSNIGTTTTSMLASLAADGTNKQQAVQIALVHLLFNLTGIIIFYPIPWMRWPVSLARSLGDITANYRWFAIFYLIGMFFLFPAIIFGLSFHPIALYITLIPIIIIIIIIIVINFIQSHQPKILPNWLKTWEFVPLWMRSLQPLDHLMRSMFGCCRCCSRDPLSGLESGINNLGFSQGNKERIDMQDFGKEPLSSVVVHRQISDSNNNL